MKPFSYETTGQGKARVIVWCAKKCQHLPVNEIKHDTIDAISATVDTLNGVIDGAV